jgi:hypothetical protein
VLTKFSLAHGSTASPIWVALTIQGSRFFFKKPLSLLLCGVVTEIIVISICMGDKYWVMMNEKVFDGRAEPRIRRIVTCHPHNLAKVGKIRDSMARYPNDERMRSGSRANLYVEGTLLKFQNENANERMRM